MKELMTKIYKIIKSEIPDYTKGFKQELYRRIFCGNSQDIDTAQISRWSTGRQKISDEVLELVVLSSRESWLEVVIRKYGGKNTLQSEERIKKQLLELLGELAGRINGIVYTAEQIIAILVIHRVRNTILPHAAGRRNPQCAGREKESKKLDEMLEPGQKGRSVLVSGANLTGKTEFVLWYLKNRQYMIDYYDYANIKHNSYEKLVKNITLAEVEWIKKIAGDCQLYQDLKMEETLKIVNPSYKQAIVVDNFTGDKKELERFWTLPHDSPVVMIIITPKLYEITGKHLVLNPLEAEETKEIFYLFNEKSQVDTALVQSISERLYGQAWVMKCIAIWYKTLCKKNPSEANTILRRLYQEMDSNIFEKLEGDIEYRVSSETPELKLVGHIHKIAKENLDQCDKSTYLLLSCFGGARMSKKYLVKWLELDAKCLENLCEKGWCIEDGEKGNVLIRIPKIVAMANCRRKERRTYSERKIIETFMDKFSREIRYEEYGKIDTEIIDKTIQYLHDFCMESKAYSDTRRFREKIKIFHLDCVRYYLMMCDREAACKLHNDWEEKLNIQKDSLTGRLLDIRDQVLRENADFSVLKEIENQYFKPLLNDESYISEKEALEFKEIIKLLLDILWSNLERITSDGGMGFFKHFIISIMDTYTTVYEKVNSYLGKGNRSERQEIFDSRYRLQLNVEKYLCGQGDTEMGLYALDSLFHMYFDVILESRVTRLEAMERRRFLLDLQFLLAQFLQVPMENKRRYRTIWMLEMAKDEFDAHFTDEIQMLPKELLAKAIEVTEYLEKNGLLVSNSKNETPISAE